MDKQTKSGMPVDESKYSFTIPRTDEPREKILKLGAMITDRIGKVTGNDPEYWGLAGVVTDEMADVALKMKVRKPKTTAQIAALTGSGLSYRALSGLHELLAPGFDILACHEELITLEFSTVREVLRHLKATGVTASGGRSRWTRSTLAAFEADYSARFRSGNRMLPLTYHPITLIVRKRPEL